MVATRYSTLAAGVALGLCLVLAGCNKPAQSAAPATAVPAAPAISAADAADAKAFLEGLYAHYKTQTSTQDGAFSPMDDATSKTVFSADLLKLMADDAKLLGPNEVGDANDGDPLCSCQDWEPFTTTVTVRSATATTAKATADFRVFKADPPRHLEFDLVKESGAWRVSDVRANDQTQQPPGPGLRETLQAEIKRLSAAGAKPKKGNPDEAP